MSSDHSSHSDHGHGGGGPKMTMPSIRTMIVAFFVLLGITTFIQTPLLRQWLKTGVLTYQVGAEQVNAGVTELGKYTPASHPVTFQVNYGEDGNCQWTFGADKPEGQYYAEIFGPNTTTTTQVIGGNITGSETVADLVNQYQGQIPSDPDQKRQAFEGLVAQLVGYVGGIYPSPDFTALDAMDVVPARQILAQMRALSYDVANPPVWENALEQRVKFLYAACFQVQDLSCVASWDSVQTSALLDPLGLREWLQVAITKPGDSFASIVSYAKHTNAQSIAQAVSQEAFEAAVIIRKNKALVNIQNGLATVLDVQWYFSGKSVAIAVDEGLQIPNQILGLGSRGVLDDDDKITLTGDAGVSYVIPAGIAAGAIPGLTPETTGYAFPDYPQTLDPTRPFDPSQPLP